MKILPDKYFMCIVFQVKIAMGNRQMRNALLGLLKPGLHRVSITVPAERSIGNRKVHFFIVLC